MYQTWLSNIPCFNYEKKSIDYTGFSIFSWCTFYGMQFTITKQKCEGIPNSGYYSLHLFAYFPRCILTHSS